MGESDSLKYLRKHTPLLPRRRAQRAHEVEAMEVTGNSDWAQWSKHVLAELVRLNNSYDEMAATVQKLTTSLALLERGFADVNKLQTDTDLLQKRMDENDRWRSSIKGIIAGAGLVAGAFGGAASAVISHWLK